MLVRIFRNLTRDAWSVQTKVGGVWRTIGHASAAAVTDATFYASEASRLRCAAAHKREVHAWVQGELAAVVNCAPVAKYKSPEIDAALSITADPAIAPLPRGVTYKPFVQSGFRFRDSGEIVSNAARVHFDIPNGCTI